MKTPDEMRAYKREWVAQKKAADPAFAARVAAEGAARKRLPENAAKEAARMRAKRKIDPGYCKSSPAVQRAYYDRNREEVKARSRARYAANTEHCLTICAEWKRNNKARVNIMGGKRRAIKRQAEGCFILEQWLEICEQQKNCCKHCDVECDLTIDHIVPLKRGGSNWPENIQGLCRSCNSRKGAKLESEVRHGK